MREMPLEDYVDCVARHLGREPDQRLRAGCEIAQDKAQTLAEVWPLIRFLSSRRSTTPRPGSR